VALILALLGTPLAIRVFSRRGSGQLSREEGPEPPQPRPVAEQDRPPPMPGAMTQWRT
jgi:hypothetical protein